MLAVWSRRAVLACVVGWVVLTTTYVLLAVLHERTLPSPYNVLIALVLSTATTAAVAALFTGQLLAEVRLGRQQADERDARVYALLARIHRGGVELDDTTDGLPTLSPRRLARVAGSSTWDPRVVELGTRVLRSMDRSDG